MAENRVIGREGKVPWHLPADMRFFKRLTTGHTVIMGRKTYESLNGPLKDRRNVVVTRRPDYPSPEGVTVVHGLDDALALPKDGDEVFVVGGEAIYRLAFPYADRIYLTVVHTRVDGDAFFPEFDLSEWNLVLDERHEPDDRHPFAFTFRRYERPFPRISSKKSIA